jgi:ATP-dependent exoDNAse (exonuclease V) alpha subunit
VHEIANVTKRYEAIAANFLAGHQAGHSTLVVSPGNDERRALNQAIRQTLVDHGQVSSQGRDHPILVAEDLTKAQIKFARNYSAGQVLHFTRAHKRQGIERDSYLTVEAVNRQGNTLTLRGPGGSRIEASAARWTDTQVYHRETRTLASGDRLQFRIHDKAHKIANGEFATITALTDKQVSLKFDNRRELTIPLAQLRHVDHGYASTSHASQGATVDRVS